MDFREYAIGWNDVRCGLLLPKVDAAAYCERVKSQMCSTIPGTHRMGALDCVAWYEYSIKHHYKKCLLIPPRLSWENPEGEYWHNITGGTPAHHVYAECVGIYDYTGQLNSDGGKSND